MATGKKLAEHELAYIRENCLHKSDVIIGKELKRDPDTIKSARKKMGIIKGQAGKVLDAESAAKIGVDLSEAGRKEFFKTQFTNSVYYDQIKNQFTVEEIGLYLEEWASLCVQFEDILATEKRQIDEFIKAEILGNRILRNNQTIEIEIKRLQEETEQLYKDFKSGAISEEETAKRDDKLGEMVRSMSSQAAQINNDYNRNVSLRNTLLQNLNARRNDRTDQLKKSGTTLLGLIGAFREREVREMHGRYMELLRIAKEKKKQEFRKEMIFADGSKECILLDDQSEVSEKDIVMLEDMSCKLINKYQETKDRKILIVDNDIKRIQFFQEIFKNNTLDYASSQNKACELLPEKQYDLICLDYDLELSKGDVVAESICKFNLSAEVIVHSENKDGAAKIQGILKNNIVEIFPFYQIKKFLEKDESNA